jgi:hypothetical protein
VSLPVEFAGAGGALITVQGGTRYTAH